MFSLDTNESCPAGEGGILVTDDDEIHRRALSCSHRGARLESDLPLDRSFAPQGVTRLDGESRIHPLTAAVSLESIQRFDEVQKGRRECAELMWSIIRRSPFLTRVRSSRNYQESFYALTLAVAVNPGIDRNALCRLIRTRGCNNVFARRGTGVVADLPAFRSAESCTSLGSEALWPNARDFDGRVIAVPLWHRPQDMIVADHYAKTIVATAKAYVSEGD